MIELCDDCEYTVVIADLIATLMVSLKENKSFTLKIWYSTELPFVFSSDCSFSFLQEGLRVEDKSGVKYVFYDLITSIEVSK